MTQYISDGFTKFAVEAGLMNEISQYDVLGDCCIIVLGFVCMLLGIRVFSAIFGVLVFGCIFLVLSTGLEGIAQWGQICAFASVLGTVLAIVGFFWKQVGGGVLCGILGFGIGWFFFNNIYGAAFMAIAGIAAFFIFPIIALSFCMAAGGAVVLFENLLGTWPWYVFLAGGVLGAALQIKAGYIIKPFAKTCPDEIRHWFENRRRSNENRI